MKLEKKHIIKITAAAFLLFLCIYYWKWAESVLSMLASAVTPIVIGLAAAYVLNILMSFYEKHYFVKKAASPVVAKTRRPVSMIAAILTLCGIITLVVSLVIPELISCVRLLMAEIPPAMERLLSNEYITKVLPENIISMLSSVDWQAYIANIAKMVTSGIGNAADTIFSAVTSVFSAITTVFLSAIFAIYLLMGKEKLQRQAKRLMRTYLPAKWNDKLLYVLSVVNDSFHRYIVGQCTEAVILGILCVIGMFILRFPYAIMIGTLIGFTALIPIAGAYIGALVGAVMILTVSPVKALLFLVFIVVLQQIEGNLIYPKVVGRSIGLPAICVLAAITIGGGLWGIAGMLIGVPVTSVIYRLIREDVYKREKRI